MNQGFDLQNRFFAACPAGREFCTLFDHLPGVSFYAKDALGRFVRANYPALAQLGLGEEAELLGLTDHDIHPPALAEAYRAEDRRVMDARQALPNRLWLVPSRQDLPQWYVSTKTPLFDSDNQVAGIAGAMYPVDTPGQRSEQFGELLPALQHAESHYRDSVTAAEMAQAAGMSVTHLNRRFRQLLRMTPYEYIRSLRVQEARRLLVETSLTACDIATRVGFADQSHLTKRFRQVTGMNPGKYRQRFRVVT